MTSFEHQGVEKPSKPFSLIFSIELWERFGYYGMQALLVIYLIRELNFTDTMANNLFGAFSALCYAFISIGGVIGDKVLGTKRTMFIGAVVLAIGYGLLGLDANEHLYLGLAAIITGNMLFKANPSSLVSKLYKPGDHRIDSAFTIYYMSINIGSFISMLLCPIAKDFWGWNAGFMICCIGLIIAIVNYLFCHKLLSKIGSDPDFKPMSSIKFIYVAAFTIILTFVCEWLLKNLTITNCLLAIAIIVVAILCGKILIGLDTKQDKMKFVVCLVLIFEAIIFFILYQQMPTSLNLFAIRNTNHVVFGITLPGESFQSLNPLWILVASPALAWMYVKLGKNGKDFSLPGKFAFGMLLCSFGFLILPFAGKYFSTHGIVSGNWLVVSYGFQSLGELLVSGLGLAMVTKLVPQRMMGFMMGAWFMSTAVAMALGGIVASFASVPHNITNPVHSLPIYSQLFIKLGIATFIISVIMFIFVPKLKKYIVD
jgi:proton-dependent oligopeptide transporter, POT family